MYQTNCGKCGQVYTVTHRSNAAFCPGCVLKLQAECREAEQYQQQIKEGNINVRPQNEQDARTVRRAIRARITSSADSKPMRRTPK